jgi:hypothetical protein
MRSKSQLAFLGWTMRILRYIEAEDLMLAKNHIGQRNFSHDFPRDCVAPQQILRIARVLGLSV